MAHRLKREVGKVVSMFQNAFVEGRQILDAVLIGNKAAVSMLNKKDYRLLWDPDVEKVHNMKNGAFCKKFLVR